MESNGNGAAGSTVLKLAMNAPVVVALKYAGAGKRGVSPHSGDEYVMFTWVDGTRSFVDPVAAAKIEALGLQPREVFTLVKRPKGAWDVARGEALREMRPVRSPLPAGKYAAPAAPAPNNRSSAAVQETTSAESTLARLERALDAFCAAWGAK